MLISYTSGAPRPHERRIIHLLSRHLWHFPLMFTRLVRIIGPNFPRLLPKHRGVTFTLCHLGRPPSPHKQRLSIVSVLRSSVSQQRSVTLPCAFDALPILHTRRLVFATVSRCPAFQQLGDYVHCARQFLYLVSTHTTFDRRLPQRSPSYV